MIELSSAKQSGEKRVKLADLWVRRAGLQRISNRRQILLWLQYAVRSLWSTPLTTFLAVFTSAVSMCLLAGALLVFASVHRYLKTVETELSMELFLRPEITIEQIQPVVERIRSIPQVASVSSRSNTEALEDFRRMLGAHAAVLEGLGEDNPLPASVVVTFKSDTVDTKIFEQIAERLGRIPQVELVQYREGFLAQFAAFLQLVRQGGLIAVVLLISVTGFIVLSTVRLTLFAREEELKIMRLVGATSSQIRYPCLFEGGLLGLFGGIIGLIVLLGSVEMLRARLAENRLAELLELELVFLPGSMVFLVLVVGVLVGVAGSWLAVRHVVNV